MALPDIPLPRETVVIDDTKIEVRSLSRSEVMRLQQVKDDVDAAEILMLSAALDAPEEDVRVWRDRTGAMVIEELLEAVGRISGLIGNRFQGDDVGPADQPDRRG